MHSAVSSTISNTINASSITDQRPVKFKSRSDIPHLGFFVREAVLFHPLCDLLLNNWKEEGTANGLKIIQFISELNANPNRPRLLSVMA